MNEAVAILPKESETGASDSRSGKIGGKDSQPHFPSPKLATSAGRGFNSYGPTGVISDQSLGVAYWQSLDVWPNGLQCGTKLKARVLG
jgi:hypothetical protein